MDKVNPAFEKSFADDKRVAVGMPARVFWTSSGNGYVGVGRIAKVNDQSVLVELTEAVSSYPHGHKIKVPRCKMGSCIHQWTNNNRYELVD